MRYQMDNYEQPTRRQLRPTETEDVAVKVRVKGHELGNDGAGGIVWTLKDATDTDTKVHGAEDLRLLSLRYFVED